jgi:hypothetical protein
LTDGHRQEPGGWNRVVLEVGDLPACIDTLENLLQAIPTTPLYDRMKSQGRLIDADPVFMVPNDRPNFKTVMPPDDLLSGTSWLLRNIYDPAQYFERSIRSIEYWKPVAPQHFSRISLSNAIRWILVPDSRCSSGYRRAYWRFWAGAIKRWC